MKFAEIAIPLPIYQTYTYEVPSELESSIRPGYRVVIPLGKRKITGYVIATQNECQRSDLKLIYDILDDSPALQPDLLALASMDLELLYLPDRRGHQSHVASRDKFRIERPYRAD